MSTVIANTWLNKDGTENYKCRAWVNFDGTTTPPTIRASGNVSSVTRVNTGQFIVNFTTALSDAKFCTTTGYSRFFNGFSSSDNNHTLNVVAQSTTSVRLNCVQSTATTFDNPSYAAVQIFR